LLALLNQILPLTPNIAIMERYAAIRRSLRPPHGPGLIGDIDTVIAATVMEHHLTMITADGDFARVSGLQLLQVDHSWLKS
jgi:predicted nucleic acid-binding protein